MRLLSLKLENWRGVAQRAIEFAPGVTVVEGPNEIGKSTIVEALQTLFGDLDSSKSKSIRAIAPVGQDVGSSVEVELSIGELNLVYGKTYNKKSATVLSVTGAQTLQLRGREAHEWVSELLSTEVDMSLWRALLVDQSDSLREANLQSSQGLAQALDEAAGTSADQKLVEDTNLYAAALAEYERYFTGKAGKPKAIITELTKRVAQGADALDQANAALQTIEEDSQDQQRISVELTRLQAQLPQLKQQVIASDRAFSELDSLREQLNVKKQAMATAEKLLQGMQASYDARLALAQEVRDGVARVAAEQESGAPLRAQLAAKKIEIEKVRKNLDAVRAQHQLAKAKANLAAADAAYYANQQRLREFEGVQKQLANVDSQMSTHLEVTKKTQINDAVVEKFRVAETALAVAQGQRDTAATQYEVVAHSVLHGKIDGQELEIGPGDKVAGVVTKTLVLDLPGVAQVRLTPSASVAEVQSALALAQVDLEQLQSTYSVASSAAAQVVNVQRGQAQQALDKLAEEQRRLLQNTSLVELQYEVASLNKLVAEYSQGRKSDQALPSSHSEAKSAQELADEQLAMLEGQLEQQREAVESLRQEFDALDAHQREVQQQFNTLSAVVAERQQRLAQERSGATDEALQTQVAAQLSVCAELSQSHAALKSNLDAANPDAVLALRQNAALVYDRAEQDLAKTQSRYDVLTDRLQQAQADGRFEAADLAANNQAQLARDLQATNRRAAAARRLWVGLSAHRDRSRQAYVQPLTRAVEALGAIVFGQGFAVELDEDWTLVSRTLNGKTLPFAELSVGAKEQLGILLRLAAAQVTAKQGGVPLIIDDALGFADPMRLATMGAAIAAAGRNAQVIILTCTPGRFTHVGNAEVVSLV